MLRGYIEKLLALDDFAFTKIAYLQEPLKNRMTVEQMLSLERHSKQYGRLLANKVKGEYGQIPVEVLISVCGCKLKKFSTEPDVDYAMFAYFEKPNVIAINTLVIKKSRELIKKYGLEDVLENTEIDQVILAHELYHFLESQELNPFPQQKHICISNFLGFKWMRRVSSLEEIAAMEFAKTYLDISVSPYIYNLIMLEAFHPQQTKKIFNDYVKRS